MKTKFFLKTLLVAACLLVGSNGAWATTYSGSVSFAAQNRITNNNNGTFTTAGNAGNQYALALADLSGLENISSATSVTLEFDVTVESTKRLIIGIGDKSTRGTTAGTSSKSTYSTDGLVMRYGTTDGVYIRVNGGSNNSNLFNTSSHVTFTLDRTTGKYSYTITYVDGESVTQTGFAGSNLLTDISNATVVEAYSWLSNFTFAISDVSYSYEYSAASFDYTIKAVDSENNELSTLASGTSTETVTVSYPRAIKVGDVWYTCPSTNNFSVEATSLNPNPTITYTQDESIVYFKEAEEITNKQNVESVSCSGGTYVNYYGGVTSVTIPVAGNYELETNVASRNANSSLEVFTADGTISVAAIAKNGSLGIRTCSFNADAGSMRVGGPYYDGKFQNSLGFDYVLIRLKSVSKTISSAGWATYCSPCPLDFSNSLDNLEAAYMITNVESNQKTLVLSEITTTVPANTGLLLKGEGNVAIPVVGSSSTDVSGNKLTGVTTATTLDLDDNDDGTADDYIYVLMDGGNGVGFYKTTATSFNLGANTAYLPSGFADGMAREFFLFEDDGTTTGIADVRSKMSDVRGDVFDLQGRKVAQPAKGLYIVNGKKVVIK